MLVKHAEEKAIQQGNKYPSAGEFLVTRGTSSIGEHSSAVSEKEGIIAHSTMQSLRGMTHRSQNVKIVATGNRRTAAWGGGDCTGRRERDLCDDGTVLRLGHSGGHTNLHTCKNGIRAWPGAQWVGALAIHQTLEDSIRARVHT